MLGALSDCKRHPRNASSPLCPNAGIDSLHFTKAGSCAVPFMGCGRGESDSNLIRPATRVFWLLAQLNTALPTIVARAPLTLRDTIDSKFIAEKGTPGGSIGSTGSMANQASSGLEGLASADLPLDGEASYIIDTLISEWAASTADAKIRRVLGRNTHNGVMPLSEWLNWKQQEITSYLQDQNNQSEYQSDSGGVNQLDQLTKQDLWKRAAVIAIQRRKAELQINSLEERLRNTAAENDVVSSADPAPVLQETIHAIKRHINTLMYQSLMLGTERLTRDIDAFSPYESASGTAEPERTGIGLPHFTACITGKAKTVLEKCSAVFNAVSEQADQATLASLRRQACVALGECLSVVRAAPLREPADFQKWSWNVTQGTYWVKLLGNDEVQASIWESKALVISKLARRLINTVIEAYRMTVDPDTAESIQKGEWIPEEDAQTILGPCKGAIDWTVFGFAKLQLTGLEWYGEK